MTFNDVLLALLEHMRATNKPVIINWDGIQQWPAGALDMLLQAGILTPASPATSLECQGCERHCFMDVLTQTNGNKAPMRAFIVCDVPEMQDQMGRMQIPLGRLQQWQSNVKQLAKVIADLLQFTDNIEYKAGQKDIRLGMLKGLNGRRWVSMDVAHLSLEINQHTVPIDDILFFEDEQINIDHIRINELINSKTFNIGKKYKPSTSKREAGKQKTQAMYQDWNDEYLRLKGNQPNKSDTWYSLQIRKMQIAKGRDAETIRKNMKT